MEIEGRVRMVWITGRIWGFIQMFYEHAVGLAHTLKLFSGTRVLWILVRVCAKSNLERIE